MAITLEAGGRKLEAGNSRGFALLVAVIFVSVVLSLGLALSSLGYKQQILASGGARSQYAFYAADAALECALVDTGKDPAEDPYSYQNGPFVLGKPQPTCGGLATEQAFHFQDICLDSGDCAVGERVTSKRFEIAFSTHLAQQSGSGTLCADVTVYETAGKPGGTTYVFAQGYDVPCSKVDGSTNRIVARGISAHF
ncbi:MAG: hypothetical protein Q7R54_01335 [bacterium]|nr:hypothetical protein [bacterium]